MPKAVVSRLLLAVPAAALLALAPAGAFAQDKAQPKVEDLTPEEIAEREARKSCKVAICAAFHNHKPGSDVSCNVIKTWRKEHLVKMISKGGVSWPWGKVKCTADIKLKRDMLIQALTADKLEAKLDTHQVACEVEQDKGQSDIKFEFTPQVTFEKGKATKTVLHWGKIEAPTLVKGAMWTATATDNTFNVLQSTVVEDINDFISNKCMEVKEDWQGK